MEHIPQVFWLIPIASVCALGMAWYFFKSMMRSEEGTPRMIEIAEYVRRGAMAYLKQQYKVVLIVFVVLAIVFAIMAYGFNAQNEWVPFAFLTGGFFSGLAGFFGMKTAPTPVPERPMQHVMDSTTDSRLPSVRALSWVLLSLD